MLSIAVCDDEVLECSNIAVKIKEAMKELGMACVMRQFSSGKDREQQKKEQYRSQIVFYKMLEEQYGQMECLRHDMKNHIIGLPY